jgi:ribonuclease HI
MPGPVPVRRTWWNEALALGWPAWQVAQVARRQRTATFTVAPEAITAVRNGRTQAFPRDPRSLGPCDEATAKAWADLEAAGGMPAGGSDATPPEEGGIPAMRGEPREWERMARRLGWSDADLAPVQAAVAAPGGEETEIAVGDNTAWVLPRGWNTVVVEPEAPAEEPEAPRNVYDPDSVDPPAGTLAEHLAYAKRGPTDLERVVLRGATITPLRAADLARSTGLPAAFWIRRWARYEAAQEAAAPPEVTPEPPPAPVTEPGPASAATSSRRPYQEPVKLIEAPFVPNVPLMREALASMPPAPSVAQDGLEPTAAGPAVVDVPHDPECAITCEALAGACAGLLPAADLQTYHENAVRCGAAVRTAPDRRDRALDRTWALLDRVWSNGPEAPRGAGEVELALLLSALSPLSAGIRERLRGLQPGASPSSRWIAGLGRKLLEELGEPMAPAEPVAEPAGETAPFVAGGRDRLAAVAMAIPECIQDPGEGDLPPTPSPLGVPTTPETISRPVAAGAAIDVYAWPPRDVVQGLVDAATHLLDDHDCDCNGDERLTVTRDLARTWLATTDPEHHAAATRTEAPGPAVQGDASPPADALVAGPVPGDGGGDPVPEEAAGPPPPPAGAPAPLVESRPPAVPTPPVEAPLDLAPPGKWLEDLVDPATGQPWTGFEAWTDASATTPPEGEAPGPAGIGVVLVRNRQVVGRISERIEDSATYHAELRAIEIALGATDPGEPLYLVGDNQAAIGVCSRPYRIRKEVDLVARIRGMLAARKAPVHFRWVEGHAGLGPNELADYLAWRAVREFRRDSHPLLGATVRAAAGAARKEARAAAKAVREQEKAAARAAKAEAAAATAAARPPKPPKSAPRHRVEPVKAGPSEPIPEEGFYRKPAEAAKPPAEQLKLI